jgi:nitroreductase
MDIWEAIKGRRSIGKVKPDAVDPALIERLLEAATWAPNHYYTEPWRFFVLTGEGRRPLGRVLAEIAREKLDAPDAPESRGMLAKAESKPLRAPVVIAVAAEVAERPRVVRVEEIGAVNAAIQNLLLAAHALGLGAIWRTGEPTYHPRMKEKFGLQEKDELLGFIYVGYPDHPGATPRRTPHGDKTKWIGEDVPDYTS